MDWAHGRWSHDMENVRTIQRVVHGMMANSDHRLRFLGP